MIEYIEKAAILYKGEVISLPRPNRHCHIIWSIKDYDHSGKQGFVTNIGRFVDRKEAFSIARLANQIITRGDGKTCIKDYPVGSSIFSEDLW